MKLEVLQEDLSKALNIASRLASPKAQLPILGNILLASKKNKLLLISTNLETSISITIGAKTKKAGDLTVPARIVNDVVSNMPKGNVSLETTKEQLKITSNKYTSTVSGMHPADFPEVPLQIGKAALKLPTEEFLSGLARVIFAASTDETRPVLTGVLMLIEKASITLVSTDGFRLSRKRFSIKTKGADTSLILPKNTLSELSRLAGGSDTLKVALPQKESMAVFGFENTILSSRLIQGEFPDFEKIIPNKSDIVIDIDKEELLRAVKVASVFARDSANTINIEVKPEELIISSQSQNSGKQKVSVDAKVDGLVAKSFLIAFNYRFLEDYLTSVQAESVIVKFSGSNAPGVFLDPEDGDYLHLIMPVKL